MVRPFRSGTRKGTAILIAFIADWLVEILSALGVWGIFAAMLLESACIPLPSEIVLPFAGILVRDGQLTFGAAVAWSTAGQMAGSILTYFVGRYGGRPFVLRYGKYILLRQHELDVAERWFSRYGQTMVFICRLLPGVRTFISLPAGVARMPLGKFSLFSFLGVLPWTALLVWGGLTVGKVWQDPRWHGAFRVAEVLVVVGLVGLIAWFLWQRRKAGGHAGPEQARP